MAELIKEVLRSNKSIQFKIPKCTGYTKKQLKVEEPRWGQKENPWDSIGKALTQRYNQKFLQISMQMQKKEQEQLLTHHNTLSGMENKGFSNANNGHYPKFQIKRKYLSFDYKGRQHKTQSNKKMPPRQTQIKTDRLMRNLSSTATYPQKDYIVHSLKKGFVDYNIPEHIKTEQGEGTYFVSNFCHRDMMSPRQNNSGRKHFKCTYVKKNRKTFNCNMNPQLQVSHKKRKQRSTIDPDLYNIKPKQKTYYDYLLNRKMQLQQKKQTYHGSREKQFRPWSGDFSDDAL